jgi:predicted methyltransferase
MSRFLLVIAAALGFAAAPLPVEAASREADAENCRACEALIDLAVAHPSRKEDSARDQYRHPAETIAFFRIRPTMKVGEYAPSGGWYSRVLGAYLGAQGQLTGLYFNVDKWPLSDTAKQGTRDSAAKFAQNVADWTGQPAARFAGYSLDAVPASEKGTFDRILIMRMIHNMHRMGVLHGELVAMRDLLKDGGMLGIEQHRARANAPAAYTDGSKGYMREKDVIALIEAHGFELVAKSQINANPKDKADHADGVWALPPNLRLGETDRAKYVAIGESDRMTLLFRKRP